MKIRQFIKFTMPLCLVVAMAVQGCKSEGKKIPGSTKETTVLTHKGFRLKKGAVSSSFRIPGELIANQQVDLYAKVSSFVKVILVDVGSEVKQGQLLVTLEAPEISSQLAGAESQLKSFEAVYMASKAHYERLVKTSKTPGTVSQNDLDMAFANERSDLAKLESAKAAYQEITDTKNYLEIRAPFAGVIATRNISPGAYVGPSGRGSELPLFTLLEQKKLRLVVNVPELYASSLEKNDVVEFTVRSFPGKLFKAKVSRQAGALDDRLRSERVEMDVDNSEGELLPRMVAEVTIPVNTDGNSFAVPQSAVLNSTLGMFVIKAENDSSTWIPVSLGRNGGDMIEVFGDLTDGDILLSSVTEEIRDNAPVIVEISE
ncbi:efflux RND transporter periplasmic adaptor subunit [Algoriphagus sp. AGSA1]|uniref:efflux RND transporter periplasmic adaptor subunit n=1 Tax=Algoriphagus sp. AGSA1 TaxID=2907213 RepID=UPI001F30AB1A|nr:efflux RND transporter periplasmic adaptor subunit [Algoriphagus sp. AGSA1]MCE7053780.1 efflux RND transporter periplasmic adaptor subunit [Algoriphagus sp. AGSA1]